MVLIDSSVWISYFRGEMPPDPLDALLDTNNACVNSLILAELIPSIIFKKEEKLKGMLQAMYCLPLRIDWNHIIEMQVKNLENGLGRVGIPDLIIVQNAFQHGAELFSLDAHFSIMSQWQELKLYKY
ncbi:MAG: PIN domain-containing protein [Spirochaetota bacterium]|jgi:predicted nucleic acid-binding protein